MAATRLRLFEDVLDEELPIDELTMITSWTGSVFPWNRTPLAGVSVVPPAHSLELRLGSTDAPMSYWDPAQIEAASKPCTTGERARTLRDIVISSLDRDLSTKSPNIATFSGGVDSSVIVALAKQLLGRQVETVSVLPDQSFSERGSTSHYIDSFLEQVPVDGHVPHYLNEHSWVDVLRSSPAVRTPMMNPTLILGARRGLTQQAATMTGGENADELFGGWTTSTWLGRHRWRFAISSARSPNQAYSTASRP